MVRDKLKQINIWKPKLWSWQSFIAVYDKYRTIRAVYILNAQPSEHIEKSNAQKALYKPIITSC